MISHSVCCPLTACKKSGICVRHANYSKVQELESYELLNTRFISPDENGCPHLLVEKTERLAYGFVKMLNTIPLGKVKKFDGYGFFGSQPTYSRSKNGKRAISPDEQERLLKIFQHCGADISLGFDRYEDVTVLGLPFTLSGLHKAKGDKQQSH